MRDVFDNNPLARKIMLERELKLVEESLKPVDITDNCLVRSQDVLADAEYIKSKEGNGVFNCKLIYGDLQYIAEIKVRLVTKIEAK